MANFGYFYPLMKGKKMAYYTLFKGSNGKFYWNLKSSNHEIIAQSEGYNTKQSAQGGISDCQRLASTTQIVDKTSQAA